jgi:two-component system nitrogen regulation response regulator GlnG
MRHFLSRAAKELNTEVKTLSPEAEKYLCQISWPGNVRQLENLCRWLTVMAAGQEIMLEDLPPELNQPEQEGGTDENWQKSLERWADQRLLTGESAILETAVPDFERIMIRTALRHTGGRRQDAAKLLGWGRNTLTRKIKELGMELI